MRVNLVALVVLILAPALAFVVVLNREVRLLPLEGIDAKCVLCDRKATRTLKRVAEGLRSKGVYVYNRSEYPAGMPVWCDHHGPDKIRENSRLAYFAAIASFALAGTTYEKLRRAR
ncbi:MAG TPA: hypothetical protein VKT49_17170 [Bryobacteraceae bacterium]|nr:hypothetical protein [Bryobacteraceae bacterium]